MEKLSTFRLAAFVPEQNGRGWHALACHKGFIALDGRCGSLRNLARSSFCVRFFAVCAHTFFEGGGGREEGGLEAIES